MLKRQQLLTLIRDPGKILNVVPSPSAQILTRKILILCGFKLSRFDQNQGKNFKIAENRDANLNREPDFHEKLPKHIGETHAITILGKHFYIIEFSVIR